MRTDLQNRADAGDADARAELERMARNEQIRLDTDRTAAERRDATARTSEERLIQQLMGDQRSFLEGQRGTESAEMARIRAEQLAASTGLSEEEAVQNAAAREREFALLEGAGDQERKDIRRSGEMLTNRGMQDLISTGFSGSPGMRAGVRGGAALQTQSNLGRLNERIRQEQLSVERAANARELSSITRGGERGLELLMGAGNRELDALIRGGQQQFGLEQLFGAQTLDANRAASSRERSTGEFFDTQASRNAGASAERMFDLTQQGRNRDFDLAQFFGTQGLNMNQDVANAILGVEGQRAGAQGNRNISNISLDPSLFALMLQ